MTTKMILAGLALALVTSQANAFGYDPKLPYSCSLQPQGCTAQAAQEMIGGPWPAGATFHIVMDGKSIYVNDKGTVVAIGGTAGDRGGYHATPGAGFGGVGGIIGKFLSDPRNYTFGGSNSLSGVAGAAMQAGEIGDRAAGIGAGASIDGGDGSPVGGSGGYGGGGSPGSYGAGNNPGGPPGSY